MSTLIAFNEENIKWKKKKQTTTTKILTFGPGCPANGRNREGKCKSHEMDNYNFLSFKLS